MAPVVSRISCFTLLLGLVWVAAGELQAKRLNPQGVPIQTFWVSSSATTRVRLPAGYRVPPARHLRFGMRMGGTTYFASVFARRLSQGEAGYLEVTKHVPGSGEQARFGRLPVTASFGGRSIPLTRRAWGRRGLFVVAAPWDRPGRKTLKIRLGRRTFRFRIRVTRTRFAVFRRSMDLGRYSNKRYLRKRPHLYAFIRKNRRTKRRALRRRSADQIRARLVHPRDIHFVTSPFHAKRITARYTLRRGQKVFRKPRVSRHSGLDLKGRKGEPIFSMLRGRVVIARKMYYEGGFTVIDHGHGVFTTYMHQSRIRAREGRVVPAGTHIGDVGASGMVTGPHLHVTLLIRGVRLSPLSLLPLPIRD